MNEQSFVPKRNFIAEIDKRIHSLEFYLRAKWYQHDGERTRILLVDCTNEKEHGHLKLISFKTEETVLFFSWTITGIYYPKASETNSGEKVPFLRFPRGKSQYLKTWGMVDYIVGEIHDRELNKSRIVYFNQKKLATYLEATRWSPDANYFISMGVSVDEQFKYSTSFGYEAGLDVLERFGIIEHCDEVDFNTQTFREQAYVNWPGKEKCYFINRWKGASEDMKTLQWSNFHLLAFRPQKKRSVTCTRIDDGKSKFYDSIQSLIDEILLPVNKSVDLVELRKTKPYKSLKASISNILAGKRKTFSIKDKIYTVSSSEPPNSKGARKKKVVEAVGGTNV